MKTTTFLHKLGIKNKRSTDFITDKELSQRLYELENTSNTINDFYEDTISMIKDLLTLYETKLLDAIKEGERLSKTGLMEHMGFAYRYVIGYATGWKPENEK